MAQITPKQLNIAGPLSENPATPYYRLMYDATTKEVIECYYHAGTTTTPTALFCATTWAEIQAFATGDNLTGLRETDPALPKA